MAWGRAGGGKLGRGRHCSMLAIVLAIEGAAVFSRVAGTPALRPPSLSRQASPWLARGSSLEVGLRPATLPPCF